MKNKKIFLHYTLTYIQENHMATLVIIDQTQKEEIEKYFGGYVLPSRTIDFDIRFANAPEIVGTTRIYFKGCSPKMVASRIMKYDEFLNLLKNIDVVLNEHGFTRIYNNKMKDGEFYYQFFK